MQMITHLEAQSLIHRRADQALDSNQKKILESHLESCAACVDYANEIQAMDELLRATIRKHWRVQAPSLQVEDIQGRSFPKGMTIDIMATRNALMGVALVLFMFIYWQFTSPSVSSYSPMPVGISPIPTPSLPLTGTQNSFENCQMMSYEVRQGDTVHSLARHFSASEEQIIELNNLKVEAVGLPKMLIIPVCELTPTSTTHPPTSTTNTPSLEPITYTPG